MSVKSVPCFDSRVFQHLKKWSNSNILHIIIIINIIMDIIMKKKFKSKSDDHFILPFGVAWLLEPILGEGRVLWVPSPVCRRVQRYFIWLIWKVHPSFYTFCFKISLPFGIIIIPSPVSSFKRWKNLILLYKFLDGIPWSCQWTTPLVKVSQVSFTLWHCSSFLELFNESIKRGVWRSQVSPTGRSVFLCGFGRSSSRDNGFFSLRAIEDTYPGKEWDKLLTCPARFWPADSRDF